MKYICRNCGSEMNEIALEGEETEPGVLYCHDKGCENRIMQSDYGFARVSEPITSCWSCPHAHLGITDACDITGTEFNFWMILPNCPLPKVPYSKEQEALNIERRM